MEYFAHYLTRNIDQETVAMMTQWLLVSVTVVICPFEFKVELTAAVTLSDARKMLYLFRNSWTEHVGSYT